MVINGDARIFPDEVKEILQGLAGDPGDILYPTCQSERLFFKN